MKKETEEKKRVVKFLSEIGIINIICLGIRCYGYFVIYNRYIVYDKVCDVIKYEGGLD